MILFDKRNPTYTIIVTTTEKGIAEGNQLFMMFHSSYTNKTYTIQLPANTSAYPNRYDEYLIEEPDNYEVGTYAYRIFEYNPIAVAEVQTVEVGLLKVIDAPLVDEFVSIEAPATDNDFLVYTG